MEKIENYAISEEALSEISGGTKISKSKVKVLKEVCAVTTFFAAVGVTFLCGCFAGEKLKPVETLSDCWKQLNEKKKG